MSKRSCGSCKYFTKMGHMVGDSGLCEAYDCRTKSDYGHSCSSYKALRYERHKEKQLEVLDE
jgi:hypothetical protein